MLTQDLDTPCLTIDEGRLDRNIERLNERAARLGVSLRPHVKTSKSPEIAKKVFGGDVGPITVSTLKEAEFFFDHGFVDILYAVGIAPQKLRRVQALQEKGARVSLILDDVSVAQQLAEMTSQDQPLVHVLIEIDADGHRAGLVAGDPRILEIGGVLNRASGISFDGVMTHAGESYLCNGEAELQNHAALERDAVVQASAELKAAGLPCPVVSVGSTPTALFATGLTGVTELRAGVYMLMDLFQAGLGVCAYDDIALSVLTTVISHKQDHNRLIVDAGGLALSKDRGTHDQKRDCGYGLVCDVDGRLIDDLVVEAANQEHGLITSQKGAVDFDRFPIGSRLRVLPNHACMTAAAHNEYNVLNDAGERSHTWRRCNGW